MRRRFALGLTAVLLLAACPTEHDAYTAAQVKAGRDELAAAETFHDETRRQIDEAEAAVAEAERVVAEEQRRAQAAVAAERASRSATSAPRRVVVDGDVWGALARCESGGNTRAVGGGGRYFGAFQQSAGSWARFGNGGPILEQSYAEQLAAAQRQQAAEGWGPWPHCSRRLGLR